MRVGWVALAIASMSAMDGYMREESPDESRLEDATSVTEAPGMMRLDGRLKNKPDAAADDSGEREDVEDATAAKSEV